MIEIEGCRYEIVIGTDVASPDARNGAWIEMREWASSEGPFLFAFRLNTTGKITISLHRRDIPLEVVSYFLRVAAEELSVERWPLWGNLDGSIE